jgi:tetratricopeptide (TPR) repeat protein
MEKTAARLSGIILMAMILSLTPMLVRQAPAAPEEEGSGGLLAQANNLLETGEMENLRQAVSLYEKILERDSDNFEAAWRCASACREYAIAAKHGEAENWKDICAEYGKKGMQCARKAMDLKPEQPHGYYYYGLSVGAYSDGVGILTALKEGLKKKTQKNLEKAYEIDKTFNQGGPILALGRFWQQVPWPYHDEEKAMDYYRELEKTPYFGKKVESYIYMAEILVEQWDEASKKEARQLLEKAIAQTEDPYWEKHARELMEEL